MLRSFALRTFQTPCVRRNVLDSLTVEEESYSHLLQICAQTSGLDQCQAVHAKLIKESLLSSIFLNNHLLNAYCKCGHIEAAAQLFGEMPDPNVVSWSALIAGFVQLNHPKDALSIFQQMRLEGFRPNEFTFVSVLNACSLSERSNDVYQIYAQVLKSGFESNVFMTNSFLTALTRHGKLAEAEELFEFCREKDIVSWNVMIAGYLQLSYSKVWSFWFNMNRDGVRPNNFTFATVLTGLANMLSSLTKGQQVHAQLVKYGHGDEICVGNALVDMYMKNKNLIEGTKAFDEMPYKDVVSWTQMADGCLHCGQPSKALMIVEQMKLEGVKPNKFTLATALNACANLASLEVGNKVHGMRIKLGEDVDSCVDNALIDMYAKCGCMDGAQKVFNSMRDRTGISWTTMIMGFAQNGLASNALKLFERMKIEKGEVNYITLICVLYACSMGGFIEEGWRYFSLMTQDHGIVPGEDHYACMVDMLGRAGKIAEAEALILSMPFQPSATVWQILLGACRIYGEVDMGRRAAKEAMALDKQDTSTYILLSNMYADSGNWAGVGRLRKLMENKEVKKTPGCSWIEVMGESRTFISQHG